MPLELRVLATLLAADLLLGVWMRLHAERWLAFFVTHIPVVGIAAAAWGFASDDAKAWLRQRLQDALRSRAVLGALVALLALLLGGSLVTSTVRVESVDPDARTRLRVVAGDRTLADSAAFSAAAAAPLNHLTTPVAFRVWLTPIGRRVWVYGPGRATASLVVFPWLPTSVQYPDDFEGLATVAVLPLPTMFGLVRDSLARAELVVRDARDSTVQLATVPITTLGGALLAFPEAATPDSAALDAWRARLRAFFTDSAALADSIGHPEARAERDREVERAFAEWRVAPWRRTRRPIAVGDVLRWELRRGGKLVKSDTTRVSGAITPLYLEP